MLSRRGKEKNAWFRKAFERPLQRVSESSGTSIDLATAENWSIRQEIIVFLRRNFRETLQTQDLSYAPGLGGSPDLLAALASFFNAYFVPHVQVKPEHVVAGAGVSGLLASLIRDTCDDGDALLVSGPFWGSFKISAYFRNDVNIVPVYVPFEDCGSPEAVVAAYRIAARQTQVALPGDGKVRGILFCNPHNPHGHLAPSAVLDGLLKLCEELDLHFISDEVYAQSTFGAPGTSRLGYTARRKLEPFQGTGRRFQSPTKGFVSVLSKDLQQLGVSRSRVHVLYSISKDLGCSGLRLGCLVTQSNPDLRMSQAILNNASVCTIAAVMMAPILADTERIGALMALNVSRLRAAASIAVEFAEFHGLTYYEPAAGLYIWLRLSKKSNWGGAGGQERIANEKTPASALSSELSCCSEFEEEEAIVKACAKAGVSVGSGADYGERQAGWFRLIFSLPEEDFLEALTRIEEAMKYEKRFSSRPRKKMLMRRFRCP